ITRIDAYLKEGNDKFTYQMAELGMAFTNAKTINVTLGSGDDAAGFFTSTEFCLSSVGDSSCPESPELAAALGIASAIKAPLNITVYGNFGQDRVHAVFGEVVNVD